MKKVLNVNLAGKAFTIDEDAYGALSTYLKSLERHFAHSQGTEDILYDIECRIAELFEEDMSNGLIVSMPKVNKVMDVLGRPKDFIEDENYTSYSSKSSHKQSSKMTSRPRKKFYRDPENKVFGGVASGLSAYFGISDPVILRILFLLIGFSFGFGIILYFILWVAIPEAKTSSDFLAMRGEEINVDNIAKTVEDGFNDIKDKIEEFGKDLKTKVL